MARPPRIWISNETPKPGEIVRVRAQMVHVMESGFRLDAEGEPISEDLLTGFTAKLDDALLMEWLPETAISQNPYIEFTFAARKTGRLRMTWFDNTGVVAEAEREVQVG